MTGAKPPPERRLVAGLLCLTAGLGALIVAVVGLAYLTELDNFNTPELSLYIAGGLLTIPTLLVDALATRAAFRYAAGTDHRGKRVAWLFAAAWLLWFAWGIPTTLGWGSAALVIYTVLVLPFVLLLLLVSWLARSGRSRLIALIPVAAAMGFLVFVVLRPVEVLGNDGDALAYSVARTLDGDVAVDTCEKREPGWSCSVTDSGGSSGQTYRVFADSHGRWKAYLPNDTGRRRVKGSGRITLRDYLRIWNRLT